MTVLTVERRIAADAQAAWALLRDFPNIDVFHPGLARSSGVANTPVEGLGAERRCDFKDGRNWIEERVVDWRPGEGYTIEVYAGTLPIRDVKTTLAVRSAGAGAGAVATMRIAYEPKLGVLGRILDVLVLRGMMAKAMASLLEGLGDKAARIPA